MNGERVVVYVGAAGTATAYGLIRSIRRHWGDRVSVVAADTNPPHLVAAARLADHVVQVPPVADPGFAEVVAGCVAGHGVDIYAPVLDEEILVAAQLREGGLLPAGTVVCAPSVDVAETCLDKLRMAEWLESRGFVTPATVPVEDAVWKGEPLFAKERRGVGSRGARAIDTEAELESCRGNPELVVQERCRPPEVTLDCYRSADDGPSGVVCRERIEVKAGVCTKARVFVDDELTGLGHLVGRELPLTGGYCLQVMRSEPGGDWSITDVNPRIGAGTPLSAAVGFDPGAAMIAAAMGLDPGPYLRGPEREHHVLRTYEEWVV